MPMMMNARTIVSVPNTSFSQPCWRDLLSVVRLPTDPLFYSTIVLKNVVNGSRYRVTMSDSPYTELATGIQSGTSDITLSNIPSYANPMLCKITIRNASDTPTYKIFDTYVYLVREGTSVYILQQLDE